MPRPLNVIAAEVMKDWNPPNYAAAPYLSAMSTLVTINGDYGLDYGKSCVLYFLANASSWRGETARRIKAELKALAGVKSR